MSERASASSKGRRGRVVGRRLPWNGDNYEALRSMKWQVHVYGAVDALAVQRLRGQVALPVMRFPEVHNERLRSGTCYLVRPDGFVAAAGPFSGAVEGVRRALPFAP